MPNQDSQNNRQPKEQQITNTHHLGWPEPTGDFIQKASGTLLRDAETGKKD